MDQHVTARNWLIGYYIFNYEQNGQDRAKYGDRLVDCIVEQLNDNGLSGRNLKLFRQFYLSFPNLYESITKFLVAHDQIVQSPITQLQLISSQQDKIVQSVIAQINGTAETTDINDVIKSPYTFEFLGIPAKDVVEESDLEKAINERIQGSKVVVSVMSANSEQYRQFLENNIVDFARPKD